MIVVIVILFIATIINQKVGQEAVIIGISSWAVGCAQPRHFGLWAIGRGKCVWGGAGGNVLFLFEKACSYNSNETMI